MTTQLTTRLTAYGRLPRERGDPLEAYSRSTSFLASKSQPIQWTPACAGKTEESPFMTTQLTTQLTAYGRLPRERGDPLEAYSRSTSFPASKSQPIQWTPACAGKTEEDQAVISRTILSCSFFPALEASSLKSETTWMFCILRPA